MVIGQAVFALGVFAQPSTVFPDTAVWYEICKGLSRTSLNYPDEKMGYSTWYKERPKPNQILRCKDEGK